MTAARPVSPSGPGLDGFRSLAAKHRLVPVWRELVADTITPVSAFLGVVDDGPGFLFESVEGGERWGRYSFVGRRPLATMTSTGGRVSTSGSLDLDAATGGRVSGRSGMLAALEAVLDAFDTPELPELPPLHAGLVGYLGYDVVREVERLPNVPRDDLGHPDAVLSVIGWSSSRTSWSTRTMTRPPATPPTGRPRPDSMPWPPTAWRPPVSRLDRCPSRPDCPATWSAP
jgi:anthranilate synthase component I